MKTYHIYGRTTYADPLTRIAEINIESGTPISQAVLEEQDKAKWVELVAIPEAEIIWARKGEAESE